LQFEKAVNSSRLLAPAMDGHLMHNNQQLARTNQVLTANLQRFLDRT